MRVRDGRRAVGRRLVPDEKAAQVLLRVRRDVEVPEHQHLVLVERVAQPADRRVVEIGVRPTSLRS